VKWTPSAVVVVRDTLLGGNEVAAGTADWVAVSYVTGTVAIVTVDAPVGTEDLFGDKLEISGNVIVGNTVVLEIKGVDL